MVDTRNDDWPRGERAVLHGAKSETRPNPVDNTMGGGGNGQGKTDTQTVYNTKGDTSTHAHGTDLGGG